MDEAARRREQVDEPNLRRILDQTSARLATAVSLIGSLEDRLEGPRPRGASRGEAGDESHPGVRVVARQNLDAAGDLIARLEALIEAI